MIATLIIILIQITQQTNKLEIFNENKEDREGKEKLAHNINTGVLSQNKNIHQQQDNIEKKYNNRNKRNKNIKNLKININKDGDKNISPSVFMNTDYQGQQTFQDHDQEAHYDQINEQKSKLNQYNVTEQQEKILNIPDDVLQNMQDMNAPSLENLIEYVRGSNDGNRKAKGENPFENLKNNSGALLNTLKSMLPPTVAATIDENDFMRVVDTMEDLIATEVASESQQPTTKNDEERADVNTKIADSLEKKIKGRINEEVEKNDAAKERLLGYIQEMDEVYEEDDDEDGICDNTEMYRDIIATVLRRMAKTGCFIAKMKRVRKEMRNSNLTDEYISRFEWL